MKKVKIANMPWVYPVPAVLAGAMVQGKVNYTTLGNCGIVSMEPPVVYISSMKHHYLNRGIRETGSFSMNVPSVQLVQRTDYCGLVSGETVDKSAVFQNYFGGDKNAPLIRECPVNMVCKVLKCIDVYDMDLFLGEVTEVYMDEDCVKEGAPDTEAIRPLIYMMDQYYWDIGKKVGVGFKDGLEYTGK